MRLFWILAFLFGTLYATQTAALHNDILMTNTINALKNQNADLQKRLVVLEQNNYKKDLAHQDKRISDIGTFISTMSIWGGIAAALLGALMTGIVVVLSWNNAEKSKVVAQEKAREAAREETQRAVELVKQSITQDLDKHIQAKLKQILDQTEATLRQEGEQILQETKDDIVHQATQTLETKQREIEQLIDDQKKHLKN